MYASLASHPSNASNRTACLPASARRVVTRYGDQGACVYDPQVRPLQAKTWRENDFVNTPPPDRIEIQVCSFVVIVPCCPVRSLMRRCPSILRLHATGLRGSLPRAEYW
jgi:hypothetical protein|eukprot:185250-Prymnesium_polylepis.1